MKDINDAVSYVLSRVEQDIADYATRAREQAAETVARIDRNRRVIPEIQAAFPDLPLYLGDYATGSYLEVDLGVRPARGKAAKALFVAQLKVLRLILGPMKETYRGFYNTEDAKKRLTTIRVSPPEYPGITVEWKVKVPNDKSLDCKVVKRTVYELVCKS